MTNQEIIDKLIENKFKITIFRKNLVDLLNEHNHSLVSAKMIKDILLSDYDYNASFDTIYKNLAVFCELNIIHEKVINHESYFVISKTLEEHHHFICLKCNEIIDIKDYCLDDEIRSKYPEFIVEGHNLEVFGLCKKCKYEQT